jgi:hypothetical protein
VSAVHSILTELGKRGVAVRVDGETLRLKPREALDNDLLARIREHKPEIIDTLTRSELTSPEGGSSWPRESLAVQQRFGQPHARLFPLLGRKVRTPAGSGTLLQVFKDHVTVVLDSELSRCSCFLPCQIEPANGEWTE